MPYRTAALGAAIVAGLLTSALPASAADVKFPPTVVWTAYDVGTSSYAHAVSFGSVLKNHYGTNIRALPGKNDVARLSPLRDGKASFSSTGSDSIYAQEGMYAFGTAQWGPQPVRMVALNAGDGCALAFIGAKDAGVTTIPGLRGQKVALVTSSAALTKGTEAMLAHGGLGLGDVEVVPVSSSNQAMDSIISGSAITMLLSTFSPLVKKLEASPRGVVVLPMPHGDEEGWKRVRSVVPWYFRHVCRGPNMTAEGVEGVSTGYPMLVAFESAGSDLVYGTTKALYVHHDEYKDATPGANGWALERQQLETSFMPFHEGAIAYYKEAGKWTAAAQANHDANLARQRVLTDAWTAFVKSAPSDAEAFKAAWAAARAQALRAAGLNVVLESW